MRERLMFSVSLAGIAVKALAFSRTAVILILSFKIGHLGQDAGQNENCRLMSGEMHSD
jgi:hypothetical protein